MKLGIPLEWIFHRDQHDAIGLSTLNVRRCRHGHILLENNFLPGDLEAKIQGLVGHYNYRRYHESIGNLTPADVYYGRGTAILERRAKIKKQPIWTCPGKVERRHPRFGRDGGFDGSSEAGQVQTDCVWRRELIRTKLNAEHKLSGHREPALSGLIKEATGRELPLPVILPLVDAGAGFGRWHDNFRVLI